MALHAQPPSPEAIRRIISNAKNPVVFHGLIDSWPMTTFSDDDWSSLFGDMQLECRIGDRQRADPHPQWEGQSDSVRCSYTELAQWVQCSNAVNPLSHLTPRQHFLYFSYKYMKDIFDPAVLSTVDWSRFGYPNRTGNDSTFWMGTAGAHTPCHYDTYGSNLIAQISGKKRWILYPPEDTPLLEASRVPYEESSVYSRINFQKWNETEIPRISGTHPHVVLLHPGDVLFVPRHWWHYVYNVQLSVSINTWLERPEDDEARLAEALVKYFMANVSRNIPPHLSSQLLNPNEEETAFVELEDVENCIRHSLRAVKDRGQSSLSDSSDDQSTASDWMTPATCCQVPPEAPQTKRLKTDSADVQLFDVLRAFCHPRVIQTVSQVLQEQQPHL